MSVNIKTINSSNDSNNLIYDEWHKQHHKVACHHQGVSKNANNIHNTYLLVGAPNVGKSTFFNKITSSVAVVSNIDRLTVSDTSGKFKNDKEKILVDLPGIYNLSHPIEEEKVVAHEIFNEHFNSIVNIVGAQSIERDLLLTLQCIETGMVSTLIINMIDEVKKDAINVKRISKYLNNINIITTQANRNINIDEAEKAIVKNKKVDPNIIKYSPTIEKYISLLSNVLPNREASNRFYALMLLEDNEYIKDELIKHFPTHWEKVEKILKNVNFYDEIIETKRRFINQIIDNSISEKEFHNVPKHVYHKIDRFLLNKWIGIPLFLVLMVSIYFISFSPWTGGGLQTLMADDLFDGIIISKLHDCFANANPAGLWISNFFIDGILAGFFAVLSFIPVILILFIQVNIINQVGILSRISVLLDRTFEKFGISGRSIVNLLTGFGCSVPAVMMARSNNSLKERVIAIIITPFISCSAKTIVFSFVCGILFGNMGWLAMIVLMFVSGLIALFLGLFFSKTLFRKQKTFFIVEMVDWRKPDVVVIVKSVWLQLKQFIKKAALIIVGISLIVWLLLHICPTLSFDQWNEDNDETIGCSLLGYGSKALQYIFVPIGFGNIGSGHLSDDGWKLTASLISAIPAKEVAITNIEMLYGDTQFITNIPEGLSYLCMIMLLPPCAAALSVVKKEGGTRILGISLLTSFVVAYAVSMIVYWFGFLILCI